MNLNNMVLPSHVFFNPNDAWWEFVALDPWMRWKRYWDCGAGMGALTVGMNAVARECVGLDMNTRFGQSPMIETADVNDRHFTPDDCLLIARPSHGSWIDTLLRHNVGTAEVLYIGLEKNLEQDLHGFYHEIIARDVGEDGENVHRVLGQVDYLERWCLLKTSWSEEPYWMMDDGDRWVNSQGGGFVKHDGQRAEVIEERKLSSFYQLKRTNEEVCSKDPDIRGGWITPEGEWLPGLCSEHATILVQVFRITEARAEELGFVRCYGEGMLDEPYYFLKEGCNLTGLQIVTLRKLGFDLRRDLQTTRDVI